MSDKDIIMARKPGRLFLLPSPIVTGGLESISPESISTIHALRFFIVENARTARRYISSAHPSRSMQEMVFVEIPETLTPKLIKEQMQVLLEGEDIGLLSEAGMPGVADPGNHYVAWAHEMGIQVVPLSGPNSIMMALMASGLEGQRFTFHGYLSAKKDQLGTQLKNLERKADQEDATQIWIEAPYRNRQILEAASKYLDGKRKFCIAAGIGSDESFILTQTMIKWKQVGWPEIHKVPAVFLIG